MRLEGPTGQDLIMSRTHAESDWTLKTTTAIGSRDSFSLTGVHPDFGGRTY